jgi:hypothetical protein
VKATFTEKSISSKQVMKPTLKRKVGYMDEEVSFTRFKMAQLEIGKKRAAPEKGSEEGNST